MSNGAPVLRARLVKPADDAEAMLTECGCDRRAFMEAGAIFVEVLHERDCPVLVELKRGRR